jgi:NAD(P)-dependent dehydrogenase (short-subunit alcohol dehydrogenase family)
MNKVVVVTGASSGIGRSIAELLARRGFIVYAASRTGKSPQGERLIPIMMDVREESSVKECMSEIGSNYGKLYAVINSAGLGMIGALEDSSADDLRMIFETNLIGLHHVCRHSLPLLRQSGKSYLINITSIAAQMSLPYRGAYCSSKFAVEGYSETLSQEVRSDGIHVVIVEPGDVRTSINANRKVASALSERHARNFVEIKEQVNREVESGMDSAEIASSVLHILHMKSPRLRYRLAPAKTKLAYLLMRILPDRIFEAIIMRHYGVK